MTIDYKDPEKARDAVLQVAVMIADLLFELEGEHARVEAAEAETGWSAPYPFEDMAYAEAVLHWEATGRNPRALFTTSDLWLLLYRRELTERFGLPCLTEEEGEEFKAGNNVSWLISTTGERVQEGIEYKDAVVTGDPVATPEYNVDPKKAEALRLMAKWHAFTRKTFSRQIN